MSNLFGRTEEVFGASYDKGHLICHGAGGGGDWNLFTQLSSFAFGTGSLRQRERRNERNDAEMTRLHDRTVQKVKLSTGEQCEAEGFSFAAKATGTAVALSIDSA